MPGKLNRCSRWIMLIASGAVMFQLAGCEFTNQLIQTGLLGTIAGSLFWLARNI